MFQACTVSMDTRSDWQCWKLNFLEPIFCCINWENFRRCCTSFFEFFFVAVLISDLMLYVVSTTVWFWYSMRHWNGSTHDRSDSWYIPLCHHILKQDFFWCLLYTILWCSTVISVWRPTTMDTVRIWCMPWHVWKLLWKLYTDQYWMNAVCAWNLPPETKNKKYRENGI